MKWVLYILFIIGFGECFGHRILGIFPLNLKSHMIMYEQLMKGLARKGHQVDVVSPFPQKTPYPNYTDIIVLPPLGPISINNMTYQMTQNFHGLSVHYAVGEIYGNLICQKALEIPQLQEIIKNPPRDPPYDLVIVEILGAHCFIAFGQHFNVPVIGISSFETYQWSNRIVANPENLAFAPTTRLTFDEKMNFWQRVLNTLNLFYTQIFYDYYTSSQTKMIKKYFGLETPGVRELEESVTLILVNSHMTFQGAKPTTPALIEVGGLHVQDDGPEIPIAEKKWMDESTNGFIYFTFGSLAMIETLPRTTIDVLYKSFAKIAPTRVLMKIPHPEMLPPGLPDNIRTFSWIPQLKVLKHKNIQAFITHGGLMGLQEAITCAVPIIGVPLWGDQHRNIRLALKKNICVEVNHRNITEESFDSALYEILHNPIYRDSAKKLSDEFLDRPLSALETGIFWVEYVIKHGGDALRSPAMDLSWWKIALLDVYSMIFIIAILACLISIVIARLFIRILHQTMIKITEKNLTKKKD